MSKNRLWETFSALTDIYSPSFGERQLCDHLKAKLTELDISVYEDDAGEKIGGNCGNIYGFLSGVNCENTEPILFSSHMDTVEPAKGKKAILNDDGIITSDGTTILGADDAAGLSIIIEAITRLKEEGTPHRPVELLFTVAEERAVSGAAAADYDRIRSKDAYVLDLGGPIGEAANAAPTILHFSITVHGKASHAGVDPKNGIHAIAAAAKAIARIPLGEPEPGLTCNIGTIKGGGLTNVIPDHCELVGEIRSLTHERALAQLDKVNSIFKEEAEKMGATITAESSVNITAYETPMDARVTKRFQKSCEAVGVKSNINPTQGGSDNSVFALHGISGLVISCSMNNVHGTSEWCSLDEMELCTQLVMNLITQAD